MDINKCVVTINLSLPPQRWNCPVPGGFTLELLLIHIETWLFMRRLTSELWVYFSGLQVDTHGFGNGRV